MCHLIATHVTLYELDLLCAFREILNSYNRQYLSQNVGQEKLSHLEEENKRLKENVMQNTSVSKVICIIKHTFHKVFFKA